MRFVAACALCLAACASESHGPASSSRAPERAAASESKERVVKLVPAKLTRMARSIVVSGTLAPEDQVIVSTKVPGQLRSIAVDLGSVVAHGQVIAQIDPADYQLRVEQAKSALGQARASLGLPPEGGDDQVDLEQTSAVKQARATLEELRTNVERARSLMDRKLIAPAEFDAANAAFLRADAALESARDDGRMRLAMLRQRRTELALAGKQLSDTVLRAPLDGVVQTKSASAGEFLAATSPVATIVRVDPLRLQAEVPEREAPLVRAGQEVTVSVEGDRKAYTGKVARVAPGLRAESRTLTIEAEVKNPGTLRPGSFARAEIAVETDEVLAVPASAIVTFAGIEKVIVVEGGRALEKVVTTGQKSAGMIEILSGLTPDEQVVREPGNLQQGELVRSAGS